ncbi:MAG: hypothetical protein Q4D60_04740 [Eubacteriales bacterium]|nr:hypothetical protein [Eubacteriales bacterium]
MDYGQENFHPATVSPSDGLPAQLPVIHGQAKICELLLPEDVSLLLSESEQVTFSHNLPTQLEAPVHKNDCIGTVTLFIDGKIHRKYPVYAAASVESIRYPWCFQKMMKAFFFR